MATRERGLTASRLEAESRLRRGATTKLDCYGLALVLKEQVHKSIYSWHFWEDFCSSSAC